MFRTNGQAFLADDENSATRFSGPVVLAVVCQDREDLFRVAASSAAN